MQRCDGEHVLPMMTALQKSTHGLRVRVNGTRLGDALHLLRAADNRVELALHGLLGQISAELLERWRLVVASARGSTGSGASADGLLALTDHADDLRRRVIQSASASLGHGHLEGGPISHSRAHNRPHAKSQPARSLSRGLTFRLYRHDGLEKAPHLRADLGGVRIEVLENTRGDALALAEEAEQEVLGADVAVAELTRLLERELKHTLGTGGEGDLDSDKA